MGSKTNPNRKTLITNLPFISVILFTNLITFLLSITFYSSTSPPNVTTTTTTTTTATAFQDGDITDKGRNLPSEFYASTSAQKLPLGPNRNFKSGTIQQTAGNACTLFPDDLRQFMTYEVNGSCPDDEFLSQRLLLNGCEPLPRRRCRAASPPNFPPPIPFPASLWSTPSDSSVVWTAYTCKSYTCLINRAQTQKLFDDCKDCFDLNGREKRRWTSSKSSGLDFSIDDVLKTREPGSVRLGLDIGGGVATFAVRMKDRNITILTTTLNLNGPFNNFIASRGVIPIYMSISQRFPFFDNTLDLVHSMHVLSNWIPQTLLQFLLFDVYRVLRPGGLFWLDHFFCLEEQLENLYWPMIEGVGFKKVMWVTGRKHDKGPQSREMYLTALFEKPSKDSW